jgi:hypothetical protein
MRSQWPGGVTVPGPVRPVGGDPLLLLGQRARDRVHLPNLGQEAVAPVVGRRRGAKLRAVAQVPRPPRSGARLERGVPEAGRCGDPIAGTDRDAPRPDGLRAIRLRACNQPASDPSSPPERLAADVHEPIGERVDAPHLVGVEVAKHRSGRSGHRVVSGVPAGQRRQVHRAADLCKSPGGPRWVGRVRGDRVQLELNPRDDRGGPRLRPGRQGCKTEGHGQRQGRKSKARLMGSGFRSNVRVDSRSYQQRRVPANLSGPSPPSAPGRPLPLSCAGPPGGTMPSTRIAFRPSERRVDRSEPHRRFCLEGAACSGSYSFTAPMTARGAQGAAG